MTAGFRKVNLPVFRAASTMPLPILLLYKKQKRGKSLILRRSRNCFFDRQMSQKRFDLSRAHNFRMRYFMKENMLLDPMNISLFGLIAVMPQTHYIPRIIK